MKITTAAKAPSGKEYVRVALTEGTQTKFIEHADKSETLSISAGKRAEVTMRSFRILCRSIIRTAHTHKITKLVMSVSELVDFDALKEIDRAEIFSTIAENFMLANYEFTTLKSKKPSYELKEVVLVGTLSKEEARGLLRGHIVGEEVNVCRSIANTPGGAMTPALLADRAKAAAKGTNVKVTILDKKAIEKEKMGALLGVAQGSKFEPRFIVMEYWGLSKPNRGARGAGEHNPIVLAGKGITFDTGGLNVKPGDSMLDMHLDMSGGASVIAAVVAAARLKLKKNVIGLIPAAENSISGESFRPGDVLTSMNGKTIDVLNTDAEGRIVLADALTYAERYKPRLVVDIATLTGAAIVALGEHASALLTKSDEVREKLMQLGEESGDYVWPLPMWDEYKQYTKGRFGDVANIPSFGNSRAGGTINGAMFLSHFAENFPKDCGWAHIDMAPRMTATASDKLAKGATGEPTRLLIKVIEKY